DAEAAQAMQDGALETAGASDRRIGVDGIAIAGETVQQRQILAGGDVDRMVRRPGRHDVRYRRRTGAAAAAALGATEAGGGERGDGHAVSSVTDDMLGDDDGAAAGTLVVHIEHATLHAQ